MDRQVNRLLEDDVDPLEHPIPVPEQIQSDENARQEPGIQTSSHIEVDMENTPDSYHDTEEIDHDTQELSEMDRQVNRLLEDDVDPLEHPIPVPEQIQSDENARQEPGIQTSSHIEVDMENTPDSYHDTEEIDHDTQELREDAMDDDTENEMKVVEEELLNKIEEVKEMPMPERPRLIKLKETKLFQETLSQVNEALGKLTTEEMTLDELNIYTYGSALYIQEKIAPWTKSKAYKKKQDFGRKKKPTWKMKINNKINKIRAEIAQMKTREPLSKGMEKKVRQIERKYGITRPQFQDKVAELQAEVKGLAAQIRNREKKINAKSINRLFEENPRTVYRNLTKEKIEVNNPPDKEELETFWRRVFEDSEPHQEHDEWIDPCIRANRDKAEMTEIIITEEMVKSKIQKYSNFKAPGIDGVPNFWLKKLDSLHCWYAATFNKIIRNEEETPQWLTTGSTSLIPKSKETALPSKYRPICCLPTTYKWLTGIIADAMYEHLESGNFMEDEQKGCRRYKQGTKDQLLINKHILDDCKKRARNLSMCWIDYKKAFDSVPHSWILRCLELYKINDELKNFLGKQMKKWKTNICLKYSTGEITLQNIEINRGIFQGDSLSPLLFCLALDPLSKLIKNENIGYNLGKTRNRTEEEPEKVSHLLFMDDLKLYADSEDNLEKLIKKVNTFSNDINMDFGLDKCSKCTIKKGKKIPGKNIYVDDKNYIEDLDHDSRYKYLGIEENANIEHKKLRKNAREEYIRRLKKICRTELTPKNKITAINQLALPVLTYGFGIIEWPQKDIDSLDVKTRKILTMNKLIYRNQCMDRVYLPRREGGLGLIEINDAFRGAIINLSEYLGRTRENTLSKVSQEHKDGLPPSKSIHKLAEIFRAEIQDKTEDNPNMTYIEGERKRKRERWRNNQRAGKFYEETRKCYIDQEGTFQWMKNGQLGFDEERVVVAAQDQGLMTNGFKKMCGITSSDQCRFCHTAVESTNHLVSGCKTLLGDGHYTRRHNKVCRYLHWKICREKEIETKEVWNHEPQDVVANETTTIFYDKEIKAGRYVENGAVKPDIVIWDKENKSAKIIEVSVPNDFGLNRAEREKVTKYQDLKNDLRDTWDLNTIEIIPVIVGATGVIKNNLKRYLQQIPGNPSTREVQTAAIRGTVSLLKRALGSTFHI